MKILNTVFFFVGVLVSANCAAHPGIGIVMDSKGNVFYTDTERVWRIDVSGRKSVVIPNVHTHELYLDADDNLFGEHLWYEGSGNKWGHYIWCYSSTGKFEKVKPDAEGFRNDYSFVRDHFGNMFWASRDEDCQQVIRMDSRKNKKKVGDECFENIRWMYANRKGDLLFMDFQDLVKVDKQGNVDRVASKIANKQWTSSTVDNQNAVFGVWDDAQGNMYAAVNRNRVVKKFDASGNEQVALQTAAPWAPTGGLVSPEGELWILECSDTNAVRVERLTKDSRRIVY